jgi:transcriptional regulator with XRE-family HTH domain
MADLRKRFGRLLAAHRKRAGLKQAELAEAAEISVHMVQKLESGGVGARFPVIEKLSAALGIDPAELFSSEIPAGALQRRALGELTTRLAGLSDADLAWASNLLDVALRSRRPPPGR